MKERVRWMWAATGIFATSAAGLWGSESDDVDLILSFAVVAVVLAVVTGVMWLLAMRKRFAERLGILPPGAGLEDDEED